MTDAAQPIINGRPTSRDLYEAISQLRERMDHRFDDLDKRLRAVELSQTSERAQDDARRLLLREQHEIRVEQAVSKRWIVGLAVGVASSVALSVFSIVANGS